MADLNYTVGVNTSQAQQSLQKLQGQVGGLSNAFGQLKTALGALALGQLITGAVAYADAISDISDATGIAIENVVGFSKAVQAAGGNSEKAQNAIGRFGVMLGDAANGSLEAQYALSQVGISLQDLRTLSETQLFNKAIAGLDKIANNSLRASLQNDIFGKTLRGVNMNRVAEGYDKATEASRKYAEQIKQAAELQDNLDRAFGTVKLSIIKAIEPLATFVNNLKPEQVDKFINAMVQIGGAAVAIVGLGKAFSFLGSALSVLGGYYVLFGRGAAAIATGSVAAGAALASLGRTASITFSVLKNFAIPAWLAAGSFKTLVAEIALTFATLWKRIGFATAAFGGLGGAIAAVAVGLGQILISVAAVAAAAIGINELVKLAFDVDPIDAMATKLENLVTDWFPGLAAAINKVGAALGMAPSPAQRAKEDPKAREDAKAKEEQAKQENIIKDALAKQRAEIALISKEFQSQLDKRNEQLQLETELVGKGEDQKSIQQALFDLRQKSGDEIERLQKAIAGLGDKEKSLTKDYEDQIQKIRAVTAAEEERIKKAVEGLNTAKAAEQFRLFNLDQQYRALDDLRSIQDDIARSTMGELEKKYYDIERAANKSAEAAIRAEEARRGNPLTQQEAQAYYESARQGLDQIKAATEAQYNTSRQFATGWRDAFRSYVDDATNAAKQAERIFSRLTQGLEDAFVNFAKTGKLSFKDLMNSIVEDLLRSQIRQLIAQTFGLGGGNNSGGGNIFSGIGSLLGFANGGIIPTNQPVLVGERGPEILSGAGGRTVIPNNAMGGSANVTYNINAVDAASFKAMIARDPSFIHAVAAQGGRMLPQGRR